MYNPQQFPMGAQGGMMPSGANPNMMPGAVPGAGMMQNAGMPINGQSMFAAVSFLSYPLCPWMTHYHPCLALDPIVVLRLPSVCHLPCKHPGSFSDPGPEPEEQCVPAQFLESQVATPVTRDLLCFNMY
jgi:hypothetical protein